MWTYYQENYAFKWALNMWKNHWLTITIAILDFIIILHSLIGIMKVGFEKAVGLFVGRVQWELHH